MGRPTVGDEHGHLINILDPIPRWSRKDYLSRRCGPPHIQTTFWRRSRWEKAGAYIDTRLNYAGDLELWTRFFRFEDLYSVDALTGVFDLHVGQKTSMSMLEYDREANEILDKEIIQYNTNRTPLRAAPQPIVFLPKNNQNTTITQGNDIVTPDDVDAIIQHAQMAIQSGDSNRARKLYLYHLIKHPFDRKITAAWETLKDRKADKAIVEMIPSKEGKLSRFSNHFNL